MAEHGKHMMKPPKKMPHKPMMKHNGAKTKRGKKKR